MLHGKITEVRNLVYGRRNCRSHRKQEGSEVSTHHLYKNVN
jgi:hypothetical protein